MRARSNYFQNIENTSVLKSGDKWLMSSVVCLFSTMILMEVALIHAFGICGSVLLFGHFVRQAIASDIKRHDS